MKIYIIMIICAFAISINSNAQIISTVAGTGTVSGYSGNGGSATNAELSLPAGIAFDSLGNLYFADEYNNVIRKVNNLGIITTVVGNGNGAGLGSGGYSGDGGPATDAELFDPGDVAFDRHGNLYIADHRNYVIRKINTLGIISTVAGNNIAGYSGDRGSATNAEFSGPAGITVDGYGNLYIADQGNQVIRKVDTSGIITTIAGNGLGGYSGDHGPATSAKFAYPTSVALDKFGNIFVGDQSNNCVRKVDTDGIITTFAGNGIAGYSGNGGPATSALLYNVIGVFIDSFENVIISDQGNSVIRKVDSSGIITTIVGNGHGAGTHLGGYSGDGGPATCAELYWPWVAKLDTHGDLYISDYPNNVIRKVTPYSPEGVKNIQNINYKNVQKYKLFPNPNQGSFTLQEQLTDNEPVVIEIRDAIGRMVYKEPRGFNDLQIQIELGNIAQGMYMMRLTNSKGQSYNFNFVVNK